jgi:hypothetical protein
MFFETAAVSNGEVTAAEGVAKYPSSFQKAPHHRPGSSQRDKVISNKSYMLKIGTLLQ